MKTIQIKAEPIELYKLLKLAGAVGSGGEAKIVISEGQVQVNGVVETQKRKKITSADRVSYLSEEYAVTIKKL